MSAFAGISGSFLIVALAGAATVGDTVNPSLEEQERFLRSARVLTLRYLSEGITNSKRATLSDGALTHDAHIQTIDEYRQTFSSAMGTELNFKDTYRANIAAYRLNRLLGIDMVPPSVERKIGGKTASVTWWVDSVRMTEKQRHASQFQPPDVERWDSQMFIVRVFDQLIYNVDRNLGNLLITNDWDLWMIDHTRSFRLHKTLKGPENLVRCDRRLFEGLKKLEYKVLERELRPYLTGSEIRALLARRDRIVELFEKKIAEQGEDAVLYDFLSRR